ncbi:hypothetical protein AJ78_04019 [Emergomyces pasteurianus Ep9510]|uniref:Zn(2)-C6 fungal-type domain-containing protein n=1 Tax=Emergomyces pasteurianus Ep9510 TaxID=1447872 RepID=A0A1J9PIN4_9EURO|nr:hypothetical protein AJ78_04019 [Emergomyces pasteurianus Ep9510]
MQEQQAERGPRGKYSRLICRGCRSRKIKCVLPHPDEIVPSGVPQAAGKSCERCRNFNLECIVERTSLGRPAAKRIRREDSHARNGPRLLTEPNVGADEIVPISATRPSNLEIRGFLYSEEITDKSLILQKGCRFNQPELLVTIHDNQEVFQSMIEPDCFLSSILANDQAFGAAIPHATSYQHSTALADLISYDVAAMLDNCLVWHRFFLSQTPTLVSIRDRLSSDECASANCATNLLFALLCLIAFEAPESPLGQEHLQLKRSVQLAVSRYGQEFIFSPPIHRDSVVVSLLLSDYRPTALACSQNVSHKAIKSGLYVNLAHRIADRLELLPTQASSKPGESKAAEHFGLDFFFADALQGLQVFCYDVLLEGFITKPLQIMRKVVGCMKPRIDICQNVLKYRQCSPSVIYHIQYMTATYILMEALVDMKQSWSSLERLSIVMEQCERKCMEQITQNDTLLAAVSHCGKQDELSAVHSLLKMRFHSVCTVICGAGLFYATILRVRFQASGRIGSDPEVCCDEAVQVGAQVIDTYKNIACEKALNLSAFMSRFGGPYPNKLGAILEMFIECAGKLELSGVAFRPPPRQLVLDIVFVCKNIVENNVIQLKSFGKLHENLDRQLMWFENCARCIESMVVSPGHSIDVAFAGGCLYAASSKIVHRLYEFMQNLKIRVSKEENGKEKSVRFEAPPDSHGDFEFPSHAWGSWPEVGGFNIFDTLQGQFDWPSALSPLPEFELQSTSIDHRIDGKQTHHS